VKLVIFAEIRRSLWQHWIGWGDVCLLFSHIICKCECALIVNVKKWVIFASIMK